jgi:uridine phosphorylase
MQRIPESELILNDRGAIYHLDLRPEELAPLVITVGDPGRVELISQHFDHIEFSGSHREFVCHTGYIGNKRITVLSSGIGPDNIDIVLNELDALINIDFENRSIKPEISSLDILRLGTSGSLQANIPVDAMVVSTHGLGIDNLLNFYRHDQNEEEKELLQAFLTQTQLHNRISQPYISASSMKLQKHFVNGFHHGITVTCPGFYGPQGRVLRLGLRQPDLVDRLTAFSYGSHQITNFEMETSAIFGLGKMLGHHCLSINTIVANRVTKQFSKDSKKAVAHMIETVLEILVAE